MGGQRKDEEGQPQDASGMNEPTAALVDSPLLVAQPRPEG
jgi:hypothetical protein